MRYRRGRDVGSLGAFNAGGVSDAVVAEVMLGYVFPEVSKFLGAANVGATSIAIALGLNWKSVEL
ncbi:hypothetical protein IMZ38_01615 [Thermosphaera chiliense]|uniref:Uncharacterized protein n=1 Tax=Thermosphaera chiliense TaxID=3402707 RepID=A0A7M1URR6_9CREN|nr:hypothetical protein [Thermosphaera aggregans]QOR94659.1 hypothetical protein IMZ38_01615 [Thermosphaera aggregans]